MQGGWRLAAAGPHALGSGGTVDRHRREHSETESREHATKLLTELWNSGVLTGSRLRPGALGVHVGWLAGHPHGLRAVSRMAPARQETESGISGSAGGVPGGWQLAGLETLRTQMLRPWK